MRVLPRTPQPAPELRPWRDMPAHIPLYGYAGALLTALAWISSWGRIGPWPYTFFPIWLGFILLLDGINCSRQGSSLLSRNVQRFILLFPLSSVFWWAFEWFNNTVQNWTYLTDQPYPPLVHSALASLDFSTVLPAVFELAELIATFAILRPRHTAVSSSVRLSGPQVMRLTAVGVVLLALPLRFPHVAYMLIWLCLAFLLDPINNLAGRPSSFGRLFARDWRFIVTLALAGLCCGFFWEMWNFYALPKWQYSLPYLNATPHLFEMPLPGLLGYLPFPFELLAMYQCALTLLGLRDDGPAI